MPCRNCNSNRLKKFIDLGFSPPSNSYLNNSDLFKSELYFPLRTLFCKDCWLVQTEDYNSSEEIFDENYAYFSSISKAWLKHASDYVDMITDRLNLTSNSFVVEIASNDGYLLKNFLKKRIPCLGIEPTKSTAKEAIKLGIPVKQIFFNHETALDLSNDNKADLIIGNNVYAHVPNLLSVTQGFRTLLNEKGTVTLEFPHLLNLMRYGQFDTIYHEHYSYFSLKSVIKIFESKGLRIYDVEEISTHGGSLRIYGCRAESKIPLIEKNINKIIQEEEEYGLNNEEIYLNFQSKVNKTKNELISFLINAKASGKKVAGYGAAAKGNTILNYAGIKEDLLEFIVDGAPSKQGKFTPGGHIPIVDRKYLYKKKPDYIIILPWNISNEIIKSNQGVKKWGCKFVTVIPEFKIH
jgi:hypothetical protein